MTDSITIKRWDTEAVIYDGPRNGLAGRNLRRANLAGANLARANLAYANLADANLARADLADANLARADLAGADLAGAKIDINSGEACTARGMWQAGPLGSRADTMVVFATDRGLMVKTGCFGPAPVKDFLDAVKKTHGDNKHGRAYRAAIECVRIALEDK